MSINLLALMKQRYDTAANWTAQNPTLLAGEIGIESDTKKWKVGTGSTAWTSLTYAIGGTYPIVNADIAAAAAIVDTKLATIATAGKVSNSATTAASANTASAIVARDASGNFTAGTITAALTGAASANVLKAGDTMTGVLAVTAGTAALPGIAVSGDSNTGIYSPGADQVAISTGGTERARIDSSGRLLVGTSNSGTSSATGQLRLGGTGSHSGSVILSNASQSVANNGTVDITVGTSSAIIYVGFLIVNSMYSLSNANRTQTTFSIFASPQNGSFTATQIATATGAGSRTFTVTSPSAGVIRVTNTSGGDSDIAMCFMGTGGFMA